MSAAPQLHQRPAVLYWLTRGVLLESIRRRELSIVMLFMGLFLAGTAVFDGAHRATVLGLLWGYPFLVQGLGWSTGGASTTTPLLCFSASATKGSSVSVPI